MSNQVLFIECKKKIPSLIAGDIKGTAVTVNQIQQIENDRIKAELEYDKEVLEPETQDPPKPPEVKFRQPINAKRSDTLIIPKRKITKKNSSRGASSPVSNESKSPSMKKQLKEFLSMKY